MLQAAKFLFLLAPESFMSDILNHGKDRIISLNGAGLGQEVENVKVFW